MPRLVVVKFDKFLIGFAHMFPPADDFIEYCTHVYDYIHIGCTKDEMKPLYVFFRNNVVIYTPLQEHEVYGDYMRADFKQQIPAKYYKFSFQQEDFDDEMINVSEREMSENTRQQIVNGMRMYDIGRLGIGVDVITVSP
jgi:hypothetical protein